MTELNAVNFNLSLTAFESIEIKRLLFDDEGDRKVGQGPDSAVKTVSRLNDVWICGKHRILCGDATSPDAVAHLFADAAPVLMITDPPYGVDYDPKWRERAGLGEQRQTGAVANDNRVDWSAAYRLFPGDVAYVWHAGVHAAEVATGLESAGFSIRSQIIWAKQHFALSRGDYHWQHEPCWYAVREGKTSNWNGDRKQSTVWEVPNLNPFGGGDKEEATGHGTQKPVELMRRAMVNNSQPGDLVYDPFLGSGSTLIAAQLNERICYGLDIDPAYVDIAVRRWEKLTGAEAVLDGDGRTFQEAMRERVEVKAEV